MRFLILNTDYPEFLADLYARHPGLADAPYREQLQTRYESLFSMADFYSSNLKALGHEAWEVYLNNEPLQRAWARENGLRLPPPTQRRLVFRRGIVPWLRTLPDANWPRRVLTAQVEHYRPDVVLNHNVFTIGDALISAIRRQVRLIVAQHAATAPPEGRNWELHDLFLSSFPPTVDYFARVGRPAAFLPLAFEPRVLARLGASEPTIPLSFVGSMHAVHGSRVKMLEYVADRCPLSLWTLSRADGTLSHSLRASIRGCVWGLDMYQVIAASQITLNHHGDVGPYANNLRLFEATGVGALLMTDWKPNLGSYFDVGEEVIAYSDPEDCVRKVAYYLSHKEERIRVAKAGQTRTLREHTWANRMQALVRIVENHL